MSDGQRFHAVAEPLARALTAGVPLREAASDLGVAPSPLTRSLQRGNDARRC